MVSSSVAGTELPHSCTWHGAGIRSYIALEPRILPSASGVSCDTGVQAGPRKLDLSHMPMVLKISLGKACEGLTDEEGFCFRLYPRFPDLLSWSRWHLGLDASSWTQLLCLAFSWLLLSLQQD